MTAWVDAIIQGVLIGGLYALFAMGLSLMFGIMRLINVAHGDLVILMAYMGLMITANTGVAALPSMMIVVPFGIGFGYILQRGLLNFTISTDPLRSLIVTFGISTIISNLLLEFFSADTRAIASGGLDARSFQIFGNLAVGVLPLAVFATAIVLTLALQWLLSTTATGRAFRASSDDPGAAAMMGIDNAHVYALATAIAIGILGVAGIFHGMRTTFSPTDGPAQLIYAFEAVIIGGLGSFWGTLAGGIILGIAQSLGARLDPGWGVLVGHVVFVVVLMLKPSGLFPKTR